MKKEENVVLSNEIEIINGVEVDWSRYKGITSGRNLSRARKSYVELCELLHKNGHTLESEYINSSTKILIDFNCGHPVHSIKPKCYKNGRGCPMCAHSSLNYGKEKLYEIAKKRNHTILGEYKGAFIPIEIDFNCGHPIHNITPDNYKRGNGCPECSRDLKKERLAEANKRSRKKAELELYKLADKNGHAILGKYKNSSTPILIDFNCGHKPNKVAPSSYKRGVGCPICKASKGEIEVARVLKEMDIEYQEQYKFEDCRNINPLPFDFYISEFNLCIEYDGEFHYKVARFRKKNETEYDIAKAKKIAEERLKETQRRDKIKTDYCRDNGINLIRIPYWEFDNIEKILKKELSKYIQAVA